MTTSISSSSARKAACIGPAPPKATSAKSRGSIPWATVSVRIACAIFALITSRIPSASRQRLERELRCEAGDGALRGSGVERHPAAGERLGIDPAEHEIRIGDGRLGAASPVARGAGVGARALRADAETAALLVGERAATGADGVDVHDRHQQRQAFERGLRRDLRAAVDDEADVEARATHVDADQVRPVEQARQRDEAHRAADRPGEQRLHRPLAGRARRDDAAARLHHVQRRVQPALVQLALQPLEVPAHGRSRVRVEHRGRRALVLAPLGGDSMRQRDREVTELLAQDLLGAQLVRRVEVGEEEADGDGAERLVLGATGGGTDGLLVERRQLLAGPVEPAADLDGVPPRNERRRLAVVELVQPRPVAAGDLVRVADALAWRAAGRARRAAGGTRSARRWCRGRRSRSRARPRRPARARRRRPRSGRSASSRLSRPRRCRRPPGTRRRP